MNVYGNIIHTQDSLYSIRAIGVHTTRESSIVNTERNITGLVVWENYSPENVVID